MPIFRDGSRIHKRGGGHRYNNFIVNMIIVYKAHILCIWSMSNLGVSGGMPPQKILKIKPSEIESEGIFNGLLSLPLQDSTLQNN